MIRIIYSVTACIIPFKSSVEIEVISIALPAYESDVLSVIAVLRT